MDDDVQRCGDPECPNYGDELIDLGDGLICPSIKDKKTIYTETQSIKNKKPIYIDSHERKRFVGSMQGGEFTNRIIDLRTGLPYGVVESETGHRDAGNGKQIHDLEEKDKWTGQMEKLQRERAKEKGHKLGYYHDKNGCTTNNIEIKVCSEGCVHIRDRDIVDVLKKGKDAF